MVLVIVAAAVNHHASALNLLATTATRRGDLDPETAETGAETGAESEAETAAETAESEAADIKRIFREMNKIALSQTKSQDHRLPGIPRLILQFF